MSSKARSGAIVVLALSLSGSGEAVQWWGPPQPGISQVEYLWSPGRLVVRAQARGREPFLILAASAAYRDPYSRRRVIADAPRDQIGILPNPDAHEVQFAFENLALAPPYEFVVKIWERLIEVHECTRGADGPCEDCRKNGFHLENEVRSTGWIRIQPGLDPPNTWNRRTF